MTTWTAQAIVTETAARVSAWTPARRQGEDPVGALLGAAMLLCELSADDPAWRPAAHDKLAAAVHILQASPEWNGKGIFSGVVGLGFAVKQAADHHGGYRNARDRLDTLLRDRLADLVAARQSRSAGEEPAVPVEYFDLISGLTGLGRYFLAEPAAPDALGEVLRALMAMTEPVPAAGGPLPGWYSSLPDVGGAAAAPAQPRSRARHLRAAGPPLAGLGTRASRSRPGHRHQPHRRLADELGGRGRGGPLLAVTDQRR